MLEHDLNPESIAPAIVREFFDDQNARRRALGKRDAAGLQHLPTLRAAYQGVEDSSSRDVFGSHVCFPVSAPELSARAQCGRKHTPNRREKKFSLERTNYF